MKSCADLVYFFPGAEGEVQAEERGAGGGGREAYQPSGPSPDRGEGPEERQRQAVREDPIPAGFPGDEAPFPVQL